MTGYRFLEAAEQGFVPMVSEYMMTVICVMCFFPFAIGYIVYFCFPSVLPPNTKTPKWEREREKIKYLITNLGHWIICINTSHRQRKEYVNASPLSTPPPPPPSQRGLVVGVTSRLVWAEEGVESHRAREKNWVAIWLKVKVEWEEEQELSWYRILAAFYPLIITWLNRTGKYYNY